ncbi:MAG TPA: MarR family transcriptional regulator [Jatrophihabitans sp.]|nr:MarR family transcriptional regulator [Jatrophihabitans sp.]
MTGRPSEVDAWTLTAVVTRLRRVLRASIRSEYPWESLPMAQVELLQRLADEPGLRLNDLAARHRLASNTVSTLVQQLVTAGLLARRPHPQDRRAVELRLTGDGARVLADWQASHERRFAEAMAGLPAADRRAIGAALPALSRLVDQLERTLAVEPPG